MKTSRLYLTSCVPSTRHHLVKGNEGGGDAGLHQVSIFLYITKGHTREITISPDEIKVRLILMNDDKKVAMTYHKCNEKEDLRRSIFPNFQHDIIDDDKWPPIRP